MEFEIVDRKPVVLTFNKYYLPGYRAGGPIRTLSNMVDRLGNDLDFRIVTLDRDAGTDEPYQGVVRGDWNHVGDARVLYLSPPSVSMRRLVEIFNTVRPDVVYLNSFFDNTFTLRVLWARRLGKLGKVPVVLAPRGEFSPGALRLKRAKKKLYLHLAKAAGLYRGLIWQTSSDHERQDVLRNLGFVGGDDVRVAMDLAPADTGFSASRKSRSGGEPLRVCFLSRISPMKNLDFALKVLAKVKAPVEFTIYGPKEVASYWGECMSLISALPPNIRVEYEGEVKPPQVKQSLARHDLFFFPTRGENYGHVIHEALSAGLPVLISDQTPWNSVLDRGVGWSFSLNSPESFAGVIEELHGWTAEKHESMAHRAALYANEKSADLEVIANNLNVFKNPSDNLVKGVHAH